MDPPLSFSSFHGNGDTIPIGREIHCLRYTEFFCYILRDHFYAYTELIFRLLNYIKQYIFHDVGCSMTIKYICIPC